MHIEQVSEHFYSITDVLSPHLLQTLLQRFDDRSNWEHHNDAEFNVRDECNVLMKDPLTAQIHNELSVAKELLEIQCGKLYPNAPQLWYDNPGYISNLHKDHSPNLTVNMQVYLVDSCTTEVGTHCNDNGQWYSVPYKSNSGYILMSPTEIVHGTKFPVVDKRLSLYQSFRSTEVPINNW
jgi:hypothetical protein